MRKIAFPVVEDGLDGQLSPHFGKVSKFTLLSYNESDHNIETIENLMNGPHVAGGCMTVVNLLKNANVNELVVGGIGRMPLMGCLQYGINVYSGLQGTVKENFEAFASKKLNILQDSSCGHHNHEH